MAVFLFMKIQIILCARYKLNFVVKLGIEKDNYELPEELREFNHYYNDTGHVIMAIPESILEDNAFSIAKEF